MDAFAQIVLQSKFSRELIIAPCGKHKFYFVVLAERFQIAHLKSVCLAGVGTFHVHDLNYFARQFADEALAAGFDHHRVPRSE